MRWHTLLNHLHPNFLLIISVANYYKPGQPNWEFTMSKFQDFSSPQILREINFGYFEAAKTAI